MRRLRGQTKDGVFRYQTRKGKVGWGIDFRDPRTGKRKRKCVRSRELAETLRDCVKARAAVKSVFGQGLLFDEAAEIYWKHLETIGKDCRSYRYIIKDWPQAFPYFLLDDLRTEQIRETLDRWTVERNWAPATRNQALSQVSGLFSYALRQGWVREHPIVGGKIPRIPPQNGIRGWLRPHEIRAICDRSPPWLRAIIQVAARTGMRLSEITELQRSSYFTDVAGKAYLVTGRTKNGSRMVWPLEGHLRTLVEGAVEMATGPLERLFPGPDGGRATTTIRRYFPGIVRAAGLKYGRSVESGITFHSLRHSMASIAVNAGVSKLVVQRMGNWKTAAMVERYAHLADESLRAAAATVDSLLGPVYSPPPADETRSTTGEQAIMQMVGPPGLEPGTSGL